MSVNVSSYLQYLTLRLFTWFVVFESNIFMLSLGVYLSFKHYISQQTVCKIVGNDFYVFSTLSWSRKCSTFGVFYAWNMWCCFETVNQIKLWCQCYHIAIHESYQREEVLLSYMTYQLSRGVKYFAKLHIDIASIF